MRTCNEAYLHCSASDAPRDASVAAIRKLHCSPKTQAIKWGHYRTTGKGFSDIGYHFILTPDGEIHIGRPLDKIGAHCLGHNEHSIGICLTGEHNFTKEQFIALALLLRQLSYTYPNLDIRHHCDVNPHKTCPNFNLYERMYRHGIKI